MAVLRGKLVVLLALMLTWSSAQCVALCAGEPSTGTGKASTDLPCHHHRAPGKQAPQSCANQQFPQVDVTRHSPALPSHSGIATNNVFVVFLAEVPAPKTTLALPAFHRLKPPDLAVRSCVVLRI